MNGIDELEIYRTVCSKKFENISNHLIRIEKKLDDRLFRLESIINKVVGISAFVSLVIPIAITLYFR